MFSGSPSLLFPRSSIHPLASLESSLRCWGCLNHSYHHQALANRMMSILNYIDAAFSEKREERAEGGNNVLVHVTTIINCPPLPSVPQLYEENRDHSDSREIF